MTEYMVFFKASNETELGRLIGEATKNGFVHFDTKTMEDFLSIFLHYERTKPLSKTEIETISGTYDVPARVDVDIKKPNPSKKWRRGGRDSQGTIVLLSLGANPDGLILREIREETSIKGQSLSKILNDLKLSGIVERNDKIWRLKANDQTPRNNNSPLWEIVPGAEGPSRSSPISSAADNSELATPGQDIYPTSG